jgi:hypothetical protein
MVSKRPLLFSRLSSVLQTVALAAIVLSAIHPASVIVYIAITITIIIITKIITITITVNITVTITISTTISTTIAPPLPLSPGYSHRSREPEQYH